MSLVPFSITATGPEPLSYEMVMFLMGVTLYTSLFVAVVMAIVTLIFWHQYYNLVLLATSIAALGVFFVQVYFTSAGVTGLVVAGICFAIAAVVFVAGVIRTIALARRHNRVKAQLANGPQAV